MSAPYQKIRVVIDPTASGNEPILSKFDSVCPQYGIEWEISLANSAANWLLTTCIRVLEKSCR